MKAVTFIKRHGSFQSIYSCKAATKALYIRECILDVVKYECSKTLTGIIFIHSKATNFYCGIASATFRVWNIAIKFIPNTLFIRIEYNFVSKQTEIGCGLILLHIFKQISHSHKFSLKMFCVFKEKFVQIVINTFKRLYVRVLCELELAQFAEIKFHHWKLLMDFITS